MEIIYNDIVNWINEKVILDLKYSDKTGGFKIQSDFDIEQVQKIIDYCKQILETSGISSIEIPKIPGFDFNGKAGIQENQKIPSFEFNGGTKSINEIIVFRLFKLRNYIFFNLMWNTLDLKNRFNFSFDLPGNETFKKYGTLNIYIIICVIITIYETLDYLKNIRAKKLEEKKQGVTSYYMSNYLVIPGIFVFIFVTSPLDIFGDLHYGFKLIGNYIKKIWSPDSQKGGGIVSNLNNFFQQLSNLKNSFAQFGEKLYNSTNKFETIKEFIDSIVNPILGKHIIPEFYFEPNTGYIVCNKIGRSISKIICSSPEIKIQVTPSRKILYFVNSKELDSISIIQTRPILTALVIAWSSYENKSKKITITPSLKYKYQIEPNSTVRVFDKLTGQEIYSVHSPQVMYDESKLARAKSQICTDIFGKGYQDNKCSKFFYNILGRAGLASIFETQDIKNNLLSTSPQTQLDILKSLKWKLDSHRKLVSVDLWVRTQPSEHFEYLKSNPQVKQILESIITNINTNHYQIIN